MRAARRQGERFWGYRWRGAVAGSGMRDPLGCYWLGVDGSFKNRDDVGASGCLGYRALALAVMLQARGILLLGVQ